MKSYLAFFDCLIPNSRTELKLPCQHSSKTRNVSIAILVGGIYLVVIENYDIEIEDITETLAMQHSRNCRIPMQETKTYCKMSRSPENRKVRLTP